MNLEKVIFGFFINLSCTLNFGFFIGEIDRPELHHPTELFAAVVVNLIATVLKFGDRTQIGAVQLATSLVASLQLIAAAVVYAYATNVADGPMSQEMTASVVSLSGGALLANIVLAATQALVDGLGQALALDLDLRAFPEVVESVRLQLDELATHLEYSSPQSFGRHVRTMLRLTAVQFRERYDGEGMLERFRAELVRPFVPALRRFTPLTVPPGWLGEQGKRRATEH